MGQKVNPIIFRKNNSNELWKSNFYGKTNEESSYYLFQSLAIRKYLNTLFEKYGLILNSCFIKRSSSIMIINLTFYASTKVKIKNLNSYSKILKIKSFLRGRSLKKNQQVKYDSLKEILKNKTNSSLDTHFHGVLNTDINEKSFKTKIVESLLSYTGSSKIILNVENIQSNLLAQLKSKSKYKKVIQRLSIYSREPFFKEAIEIFVLLSKKIGTAKLLARFIALQIQTMKRHNNFLTFLKRTVFIFNLLENCGFQGLKILISGRFNNAPRGSSRLIQYGRIPLQSIDTKIDYYQTEAFTPSGVFGVKVWICLK
jgi:ribosomal protein S3